MIAPRPWWQRVYEFLFPWTKRRHERDRRDLQRSTELRRRLEKDYEEGGWRSDD